MPRTGRSPRRCRNGRTSTSSETGSTSDLFERLVLHIRTYGHEGRFYEKVLTYHEEAGLVYWTMGAPLPETTIVNRCRSEDTYESRLAAGTLP